MPSVRSPFCTHSCMTDQMCSRPSRTSASVRRETSFSHTMRAIDRPVSSRRASISVPLVNGCGTGVWSTMAGSSP